MTDARTLARPYAKAIFELAREASTLDQWLETLTFLAELVVLPEMAPVVKNPLMPFAEKTDLVIKALASKDDNVKRAIALLVENERLYLAPAILDLFELYKAEFEHKLKVEIISAYALDEAQLQALAKALEKKLSREVTIETQVDKTILGGVIIKIGDKVIDGSGQGALVKLENYLKGSLVCN